MTQISRNKRTLYHAFKCSQKQDLCLITLELIIRILTRKRNAKSTNYHPVWLIYNWKWQKRAIAMSYKAISNKEPRIIHSLGLFSCFVSAHRCRRFVPSSFLSHCWCVSTTGRETKMKLFSSIDFLSINQLMFGWLIKWRKIFVQRVLLEGSRWNTLDYFPESSFLWQLWVVRVD